MNPKNQVMMNKSGIYVIIAALLAISMTSCKEKKQSDNIITTKPVAEVKKPTQEVGNYDMTTPVDWVGSTYQVVVERKADHSLPLADDGQGNKYYDNRITVKVIRKDGSSFFNRTFTKEDFAKYVDPLYRKNSALLGIVLDKAEGDNLVFAASVGSPDKMSDEYVPLLMKISRFGDVAISKDTQLDTGAVETDGQQPADNPTTDDDEDGV
jgi:hypothetical protein